jgi:hypothetical protein
MLIPSISSFNLVKKWLLNLTFTYVVLNFLEVTNFSNKKDKGQFTVEEKRRNAR